MDKAAQTVARPGLVQHTALLYVYWDCNGIVYIKSLEMNQIG